MKDQEYYSPSYYARNVVEGGVSPSRITTLKKERRLDIKEYEDGTYKVKHCKENTALFGKPAHNRKNN